MVMPRSSAKTPAATIRKVEYRKKLRYRAASLPLRLS
jgi:hypothetical protein